MGKAPVAGLVKTRMAPFLSLEEAAELSRCLLLDTLELVMDVGDWDVVLAYTPDDALERFPTDGSGIPRCIPQGEGSMGDRMRQVFETLFMQGFHTVVMIGTDLPTLPLKYLHDAFTLLEDHPVVLGPCMDGGYYLLGLRNLIVEIFEDIDWSTIKVLHQTTDRLAQKNIRPACLPPWYDVDNGQELDFLIAHLELLQICEPIRLPLHTVEYLHRARLLSRPSAALRDRNG